MVAEGSSQGEDRCDEAMQDRDPDDQQEQKSNPSSIMVRYYIATHLQLDSNGGHFNFSCCLFLYFFTMMRTSFLSRTLVEVNW